MIEGVINILAAILMQVFIGLLLGLFWNNGMVNIGYPQIDAWGATSLWLFFIVASSITLYIWTSIVKHVLDYNRLTITNNAKTEDSEKKELDV